MTACCPAWLERDTHLRFDLSLRLAQETIRPLIQFARGRLIDLNVTILVGPHLFAYILIHSSPAGRQEEAGKQVTLLATKMQPA